MAIPICFRLLWQEERRAFSRARPKTGNRIAAKIAIIAITTNNSIIGIVLFPGAVFAGVSALAAPSGLRRWYWRVYALFVAAAVVLVHVFAYRSVFEYGSLCPWCMVVWLVTIPLFWTAAGWSLRAGVWGRGVERLGAVILAWTPLIVVVDYLVIAVAAQLRLDVLGSL